MKKQAFNLNLNPQKYELKRIPNEVVRQATTTATFEFKLGYTTTTPAAT